MKRYLLPISILCIILLVLFFWQEWNDLSYLKKIDSEKFSFRSALSSTLLTSTLREDLTMRIDQFTTQAQSAVLEAQTLATTEKHAEVQPIHLLTVMLASKQGTTSSVLGRAGTDATR